MPWAPLRPCNQPGCGALSNDSYCPTHKRERDQARGSAASRGYGHRWRIYRERYLKAHPLCVECLKRDETTAATVVDHITPHKGDRQLFWDPTNHQALCKPDHDRKTATDDGRWG